jgi:hypothetical protein
MLRRGWIAPLGSAALCLLALGAAGSPAASAQLGGDECLSAGPPPLNVPAHRLRFGITPLLAGSAGLSQSQPKPENESAALAALQRLRPGRRQLVLRLNRMSMADGVAGIQRYAALVDRYAKAGFDSELQVRYHPGPGQEGDMAAWRSYVTSAAAILGKRPSVKALTVTNEANFPVSPNTSDGSFAGVRQAIVTGILAARKELDRIGRPDVELGFSFAWRWLPSSDADFWRQLGTLGSAEFRRAVDYVGLQIYPHLVYPPAPLPGRTAGDEMVEALTLLRNCYMPQAGLGGEVGLWVTENGYPTNLGRTEDSQVTELATTLDAIHRYSGTLGLTDYRWFNLRDNDSTGTDLFDAVGLLRDDYSEKPAFAALRTAIDRLGTDRPRTRRCGKRVATIVGTDHRDNLRGGSGPDVIFAGRGADKVTGNGGADLICGGPGPDRLRGGPGRDTLIGGPGGDRLTGDSGRDRCPHLRIADRARSCDRGG